VAVSSGVYSLAGVVIGGGVTWFAQWSLAARADRRDARVAHRQVRSELRRAERWVRGVAESPDDYARDLAGQLTGIKWSAKWEMFSDQLARALSDRDWEAVESAYESIGLAIALVGEVSKAGADSQGLVVSMQQAAELALTHIDEARTSLRAGWFSTRLDD
jgi:hypothetical protein